MSSNIKFNLDLYTGEWSVDDSAFNDIRTTVFLGFTDSENPVNNVVNFNSLHFNFLLSDADGNVLKNASFPRDNHLYISTDQDYLESLDCLLEVDKSFTLKISVDESGSHTEIEYEMIGPRPKKPYTSWYWDDDKKGWEAPVEYPTDGTLYAWDESSLSWQDAAEVAVNNILVVASGQGNYTEESPQPEVEILSQE